MNKIVRLTEKDRNELFRATAEKKGITEAVIEKDFWACLVLKTIFESDELKDNLLFKGGTSLSKCYNLINRFSEDIDLVLDWRVLGIKDNEAWEERSGTQQDKFNSKIDELARTYIAETIVPDLNKILKEKTENMVHLKIDKTDGHIVTVHYPALFSDKYLLDYVKLEIGPRASRMPQDRISIHSYAGEEYPNVFDNPGFFVNVIKSERTFWEKATIAHQIASVDEGKLVPPRYSRHYYDLYQMINSKVKENALADLDLLKQVTDFKSKFYRSPSARYDLAKPGTFKLLPSGKKCISLSDDYDNMQEMIFGSIPEFSSIKNALDLLEKEINLMKHK